MVVTAAVSLAVGVGPTRADTPVDEVHYTFTTGTSVAVDWRGTATDLRYGPTAGYGTTVTAGAPGWTPISSPGPFREAQISGGSRVRRTTARWAAVRTTGPPIRRATTPVTPRWPGPACWSTTSPRRPAEPRAVAGTTAVSTESSAVSTWAKLVESALVCVESA
ncbi:MAG: hypothetical protein QOF53_3495, partial [Nocardioidaceae bacterium]|nr:hypothetical protein [Nocardioidaceae bacterium]